MGNGAAVKVIVEEAMAPFELREEKETYLRRWLAKEVDMPEEGEGGGEGGGEMSLPSEHSSTAAPAMRASVSSTTASTLLQLPAASSERSPSTPPARAIARA